MLKRSRLNDRGPSSWLTSIHSEKTKSLNQTRWLQVLSNIVQAPGSFPPASSAVTWGNKTQCAVYLYILSEKI